MDISFKDAKMLWSGIWHKEVVVNKKRRWLMQLLSHDANQVTPKKLRKPKSLSNRFLDESFVRNDEVSSRAVKINIENYRSMYCADERLLEVQNYTVLSDVLTLQSYFTEPSNLKKFHSTLDLLSNNALSLLANLVTKSKTNYERTRPRMKKVIEDHFRGTLSTSNDMKLVGSLQLLCEVLINPKTFYEKQPSLPTLDCSSDVNSIYMALELLDIMPLFVLNALNWKLRGKKVVPHFPPIKHGYNKKVLVNLIRKRCQHFIFSLNHGNSMPEELSKALSVIHLFLKLKTKSYDTLTSAFISSSKETVILQNDILKALWSLPTVTSYQLEYLQSTLGLKLGDDSSRFLNDLKQYLMQYLFSCDEVDIPSDIYEVLAILNNSSCSQTQICSKETIEEETEAVLNVSVELKQIVLHLESDISTDYMAADALESDDDTICSDSQIIESDFCTDPVKYQQQQVHGLETSGDSMPGTSFIPATSDNCSGILHCKALEVNKHACVEEHKERDDVNDLKHPYNDSMENFLQSGTHVSKDCSDISIKELCDETSLVSYRIIDHMLNSFLSVEGRDASVVTRGYQRGQASPSITFQGKKGMLFASGDNDGIEVLMQSVKELLPSITKRCSQSVEELMKKP